MLFILVATILATFGFKRKLSEKGYGKSRVWMLPVLVGSLVICLSLVCLYLARFLMPNAESGLSKLYPLVVDIFGILVFGLVISRVWGQIKALPEIKE